MAVVTAVIITSFTLFSHSIVAVALLKPFLTEFVLPVIWHSFSIPYFFFSKNMIALAYIVFCRLVISFDHRLAIECAAAL